MLGETLHPTRGEGKYSLSLHATETRISSSGWATWLVCELYPFLPFSLGKRVWLTVSVLDRPVQVTTLAGVL